MREIAVDDDGLNTGDGGARGHTRRDARDHRQERAHTLATPAHARDTAARAPTASPGERATHFVEQWAVTEALAERKSAASAQLAAQKPSATIDDPRIGVHSLTEPALYQAPWARELRKALACAYDNVRIGSRLYLKPNAKARVAGP